MGVYSDYLDKQFSFEELCKERKRQLKRISELRNRDIMVYAAPIGKSGPTSIDNSDILPFSDQLSYLKSKDIDIIIETPGGFAEVVEDLVKLIRSKHDKVGVLVPGIAKSAGTIFAMGADEILMGDLSALGPIDAQIVSNGKRYSADAFLDGLEKIKQNAAAKKTLDLAYIPMLQNLSPGEIQHCENAQQFSRTLVKNWLMEYKFNDWTTHSSTNEPVTKEEKEERADQIAGLLCKHDNWLTHARSIKIQDLREMKLKITDYREDPDLNDAISRYYALLQMTFDSNIYKLFETPDKQIYRSMNPLPIAPHGAGRAIPNPLMVDLQCGKCQETTKVQINFEKKHKLLDGAVPFPSNNKFMCPHCGTENDVLGLRQQLEAQIGRRIV